MTKSIDKNKARQGRTGAPVLVVLVCALALALIVWWGVGIFGSSIAPDDPVGGAPAEQPEEALPNQIDPAPAE